MSQSWVSQDAAYPSLVGLRGAAFRARQARAIGQRSARELLMIILAALGSRGVFGTGVVGDRQRQLGVEPRLVIVSAGRIFRTVFSLDQVGDHLRNRFALSL